MIDKKVKRLSIYFTMIVFPLLFGYFLYLIFMPELPITKFFYKTFPDVDLSGFAQSEFLKVCKPYLCDFFWAFSLTFAVSFVLEKSNINSIKSFCIAFLSATILESLQITELVYGTFDFVDILVELLACIIAAVIIKIFQGVL